MDHLNLLETREFANKIRLGSDIGYVIADLGLPYDCYISAGVSDEESFSRDFINRYKIPKARNFAFDGTISDYPWNYTTEIQYIRKSIGGNETETHTNLHDLIDKHRLIFLKMDIEGGEYEWFDSLTESQLSKFAQIVIEFHGITSDSWGRSYADKVRTLEKLSHTHYIIHSHGNNHRNAVNRIPDVIELTYVNKNLFSTPLSLNRSELPDPALDRPNYPGRPDHYLGFYPFVYK